MNENKSAVVRSGAADARIQVVIPVLNEAVRLPGLLASLFGAGIPPGSVIVVDGGSKDDTARLARAGGCRLVQARPGRARQMNAGVLAAQGGILWFVHADCIAPSDAPAQMAAAIAAGAVWGRFDVHLGGPGWLLRVIERLMNGRSCLTGVATGDQGMFMTRAAYEEVGGFPDIPLMEDIAISKRLRDLGRPACVRARMQVSARRWQARGVWRTMLLMWWLRLLYFFGVSPGYLYGLYYGRG